MKKPHHPAIRELLRKKEFSDGLTAKQICTLLPQIPSEDSATRALKNMVDTYVDRWEKKKASRGQYSAVWCVVVPPENCPYPTETFEPKQPK